MKVFDPQVVIACFGTRAANQLGFLIRVAKVHDTSQQHELIKIFDRSRKNALSLLESLESREDEERSTDDEAEPDNDPLVSEEEFEADVEDEPPFPSCIEELEEDGPGEDGTPHDLERLLEVLGTATVVDGIEKVTNLQNELRHQVTVNKRLQKDLKMWTSLPVARFFTLLDVKTTPQALKKLEELTGGPRAA